MGLVAVGWRKWLCLDERVAFSYEGYSSENRKKEGVNLAK